MGEGLRGSNGACSSLHRTPVTPSATHNQTGPLWCWFPSGWACAHCRPLWVSPTTSPVRLGVSPAAAPIHRGAFNQRFEALFPPSWSPGLCGLLRCLLFIRFISLDECLFSISLVSVPLAVRFSVSSGCARRRSVSTYAAILVPLEDNIL